MRPVWIRSVNDLMEQLGEHWCGDLMKIMMLLPEMVSLQKVLEQEEGRRKEETMSHNTSWDRYWQEGDRH